MTMYEALHPKNDVGRLYIKRKEIMQRSDDCGTLR